MNTTQLWRVRGTVAERSGYDRHVELHFIANDYLDATQRASVALEDFVSTHRSADPKGTSTIQAIELDHKTVYVP